MKNEDNKKLISTVSELQAIRQGENGEPLVDLEQSSPGLLCDYRRKDSGINSVSVRKSVAERLQRVQRRLTSHNPGMQLLVVEGYRSLVYQERYFMKQLLWEYNRHPDLDFERLVEQTHRCVALPSVAGHPTGGAVDVTIAYEDQEVDMGGKIADFAVPELLPTYSGLASPEQTQRRILLLDCMVAEGFAPFYGEWWHFSFGDREWAAFYDMPEAFYSPTRI